MEASVPIVHLGFLEKPKNKLCTRALFFPSFIGGEPAFICKEKFIPEMTVCQRCNSRLTFIGQIYCPVDDNPQAFHRVIYIYACLKGKCKDSSEAVRVFRCQLPQVNPYFNKQSPNYSLLDLSDKQLEAKMKDVVESIFLKESEYETACKIQHQSKKLSSVYVIEINTESEKLTSKILKKQVRMESQIYDSDSDSDCVPTAEEQALLAKFADEEVIADSNEEVVEKYIKNEGIADADVEKTKAMLADFEDDKNDSEEQDYMPDDNKTVDKLAQEFDKENDAKLDKEFEVFLEATKETPDQVIRYCQKGMLPLWSSKKYKMSKEAPRCENCGAKRKYEMQLMPALYNYVNEMVNLNWNSMIVYTCEKSCVSEDFEYVEEFGFVELQEEGMGKGLEFSQNQAVMDVGRKKKKVKEEDKKEGKKEGPTKPGLDEETEKQIQKQLEELQLDFD